MAAVCLLVAVAVHRVVSEVPREGEQAALACVDEAELDQVFRDAAAHHARALTFHADRFRAPELARADALLERARGARHRGESHEALRLAGETRDLYKQAADEAYMIGTRTAVDTMKNNTVPRWLDDLERAKRRAEELRRDAEAEAAKRAAEAAKHAEAMARLQAENDRLRRQLEAAVEVDAERLRAQQAALDEELRRFRRGGSFPARIAEVIELTHPSTVLIETRSFVVTEGNETDLPIPPRYGSGFLYGNGVIVTAKSVLLPEVFDPKLAGLAQRIRDEGYGFVTRYAIWVWSSGKRAFVRLEPEAGVHVGPAAPDAWLLEPVETELEFGAQTVRATVRLHDPARGNLATLRLTGRLPRSLRPPADQPDLHDILIAVGSVLDGESPAVSPLRSYLARRADDGRLELPAKLEAPASMLGAPVVNFRADVVGVVTEVGPAQLRVEPIASVDELLGR